MFFIYILRLYKFDTLKIPGFRSRQDVKKKRKKFSFYYLSFYYLFHNYYLFVFTITL